MKVERTTFECDGIQEPCIMVSTDDGFVKVRISKCYHYIGKDSLYVNEYIDGTFNSSEEINGDYDTLSDKDAKSIALKHSAYLYD